MTNRSFCQKWPRVVTDLSVLAYWGQTFVFKNKGAGLHAKNKCQKCVLWLQDSPVGGWSYSPSYDTDSN